MNDQSPLFREAARHPSEISPYGQITLIRPTSFFFLTCIAAFIALIIIVFFTWGTYTKRSTLTGQLMPDLGLIKVYTPQFGTIIEKHAVEGKVVKHGEMLYVISSELRSSALGDTQAILSQQTEQRRQSFRSDIRKAKSLEQSELASAQIKLDSLQAELIKINELIDASQKRVALAEDAQSRYDSLSQQGFMSKDQLLVRQTDLLDQRARLKSLERDHINLVRQINDQQTFLKELPLKYQSQIADYERSVTSTDQELTQTEARRRFVITAPADGITTTVLGDVGQNVDSSRPLLSIVPKGAQLEAQLYAPSRAIGFIKPGNVVYLRYQAYPYQKFGHYIGTVKSVSMMAIAPGDLVGNNSSLGGKDGEQVYRIIVDLKSQNVLAYGKAETLQAGMLVDADILQETRKLYEWVLEPLITLTGKLH